MMIQRIDHVNLVVDDLQEMVAFYRDVLGLRLTKRASISGQWIEALTGFETVEADVAFRVTELDTVVASLKAADVELLSDIQQVSAEQVDYADERKRIAYCRDPEGSLLELCEFK